MIFRVSIIKIIIEFINFQIFGHLILTLVIPCLVRLLFVRDSVLLPQRPLLGYFPVFVKIAFNVIVFRFNHRPLLLLHHIFALFPRQQRFIRFITALILHNRPLFGIQF